MTDERTIEDRILAIFLDAGDVYSVGVARLRYSRIFGEDDESKKAFGRSFWSLVKREVLIEYDTEAELSDLLLVEHSEYGTLSSSDLSYIGFEDLAAIGPNFIAAVRERASEVCEQALIGGLSSAVDRLKALPIESWKWTGLPAGFVFDENVKSRVMQLLRSADDELSGLQLSNHETSQARALIKSAIMLADAPKPEIDLVWEIVQPIAAIIGIASGIQSLSSIFRSTH